MKTFGLLLILLATGWLTIGFQMVGSGENRPTVQSALNGRYYVRSVHAEQEFHRNSFRPEEMQIIRHDGSDAGFLIVEEAKRLVPSHRGWARRCGRDGET